MSNVPVTTQPAGEMFGLLTESGGTLRVILNPATGLLAFAIQDDGTPMPLEPALNVINGDLADNPGVATDLTLHYQFWQDSDGDLAQRRAVHPNTVHFDVTDDIFGDATRFALHSPITPTVGISALKGEYYVDPGFVGTSTGSESNPFTTYAAAFAFAATNGVTSGVVFQAPGTTVIENVAFPATGGTWEIACQQTQGALGAVQTTIQGTLSLSTSGNARFAVSQLHVTGAVSANNTSGSTCRISLRGQVFDSTFTLTGTPWRVYTDGMGSGGSNGFAQGGLITGATTVVGEIHGFACQFGGPIAWTVSSSFDGCYIATNSLTNTSGANSVTFFDCIFTAVNTTLTATAGSCVALFDGPSSVQAFINAGFLCNANCTTRTLNANGSTSATIANNVVLTPLFNRCPESLVTVEGSFTILTPGTLGTAVINAVYVDLTGTTQVKPLLDQSTGAAMAVNITSAAGTEVAGRWLFAQNGSSTVSFTVTGIVTPGPLSAKIKVAARQLT